MELKLYAHESEGAEVAAEPRSRAKAITVVSILFFVIGTIGVLVSIALIALGALLPSLLTEIPPPENQTASHLPAPVPINYSLTPISPAIFGQLVMVLGLLLMILSALYIVAGYWLWKSLRRGGVLGIVLCAISMIFSFFLGPLAIIGVVVSIVLIVLISIKWETLR